MGRLDCGGRLDTRLLVTETRNQRAVRRQSGGARVAVARRAATRSTGEDTHLVRRLQRALDRQSTAAAKVWFDAYMKGAIRFRGVGLPRIRPVVEAWRSKTGIEAWSTGEQFELALRLFEEPMAEDKLAGVLFVQRYLRQHVPWRTALTRYASLFRRGLIADWNTCDWFCVRVVGPTIAAEGPACAKAVARWSAARDVWQARASVVGFVTVVDDAEYHPLIVLSAARLVRRPERFAKTGVGWILRELSKHDRAAVVAFVEAHAQHLSTEAVKNALKYASKAERGRWVKRVAEAGGRSTRLGKGGLRAE